MKNYRTQDREAGNAIAEFETLEDAQAAVARYEQDDKAEGTYSQNFYEIAEFDAETETWNPIKH